MSLFFAFIAGVVTILSPCVLPLLPVILATTTFEGRARPIGLIFGFTACFTIITLALSILVRQFSIPPDIHRTAAALIFIVMGLLLAVPMLKTCFENTASRLTGTYATQRGGRSTTGFSGGLIIGAGLGLAWTPCVGPIMAAVITLALNQETTLMSSAIAIAFSLGTALPMGIAVLLGSRFYSRIGILKRNSGRMQQAMGFTILLVGLAIWFGIDRLIQIELFKAFPGWESTLTGWEKNVAN